MTLGEKIIRIRKEQGLNQRQFAEKFHVTRQTVSNWENDRNYPDMSSLKMISDEYGISFDELLKDDEEFIRTVDETKKKLSLFKRGLIVALIILTAVAVGFFVLLYIAFQPTEDGKRINSDTAVKMLVDLPGATPSRAITYTTGKSSDSSGYERIIDKYKKASKGRIEGDIPCVVLEEKPKVSLRFQDLDYNDIPTYKVRSVEAELVNVISDDYNTKTVQLDYSFTDGQVVVDPSQLSYDYDAETGEIWYDVALVVKYEYEGNAYTSVTAFTVLNENR